MRFPLTKRKDLLKALVAGRKIFKFSESFEDGPDLYRQAIDQGLEGIVAKKKESTYHPGTRSYDWVKVPTKIRQEFVIGTWVESEASRPFKSLLFGAYDNGQLKWIGRSGGGFKDKEMPGILAQLQQFEVPESPFVNKILDTPASTIHYAKPLLVANFEFATWTKSGRIRKPATFLGFRDDKNPKDVVLEVPAPTPTSGKGEKKPLNNLL